MGTPLIIDQASRGRIAALIALAEDHPLEMRSLAAELKTRAGKTRHMKPIVSGYSCPLYDELFAGWRRVERNTFADGARERTEVLWLRNVQSRGMLPGME